MNIGKFDEMYKLLFDYKYEINKNIPDELKCTKCKNILINACQVPCGCRYCYDCVNEMLENAVVHCPGNTDDCKEECLSNNQLDFRVNKAISKFIVKCPEETCSHECELLKMEEHLRICGKKSMKCPFADLGCDNRKMESEILNEHCQSSNFNHCKILIEMIDNIRNEMDSLKIKDGNNEIKIEKLEKELKVKSEEMKLVKLENENLKQQFESLKENMENRFEDISEKMKNENQSRIESINDETKSTIDELDESLQMKNAIGTLTFNCYSLYDKDNADAIYFIDDLYYRCPDKLKVFFENNLALTLFPEYSTFLLKDFINHSYSLIAREFNFTSSILTILWNSTNYSENIVKKLLMISNFKECISSIITKTNLTDENGYNIVLSAINIVNNVVRREPYRHSFDKYYISDRIFEVLKMDKTDDNYKLGLTFMICFIFPLSKKALLGDLFNQFKENVLIYLDGASNIDNFVYEIYSSDELLSMIKVSSTNKDFHKFYSSNFSLKKTLIRFLHRNHQIDLVMSIIVRLYNRFEIQQLETLYASKNETQNEKIREYFDSFKRN